MRHQTLIALSCLVSVAAPVAADTFTDDFADNAVGSTYTLIVDNPAALTVAETGGAARVTSTGGGLSDNDAIYLSNGIDGFRLSTASDFTATLGYSFAGVVGGSAGVVDELALVLGIGEDLDGQNSAAIGFGYSDRLFDGLPIGAGVFGYRVADVTQETAGFLTTPTGQLTISYDAADDALTVSAGGATPLTRIGIVQGQWNADSVYFSFGVRGSGYAAAPATTFVDNLSLTGTFVAVPEPTSAVALLGGLGLLAARRRR